MPDKGHKSTDPQLLKANESATGTIKYYFNRNTNDPCLYQSSLLANSWELLKHFGKLQVGGVTSQVQIFVSSFMELRQIWVHSGKI